jgi:hypothetical protein
MNILDPAYIKLWFQIAFPFILILAVVLVPLFGIWYELREQNKNHYSVTWHTDDKAKDDDDDVYDKFDERIK